MQRISTLAKHLFALLRKIGQPEMTSIDFENPVLPVEAVRR